MKTFHSTLRDRAPRYGLVIGLAMTMALGWPTSPLRADGTIITGYAEPVVDPVDNGLASIAAPSGLASFPSATVVSEQAIQTGTSGAETTLGSDTPFGQVFGTSSGQRYLSLAAGTTTGATTITTITFGAATPTQGDGTGWGFTLGDVDAEQVKIEAFINGTPIDTADLGFQSTFNYRSSDIAAVKPTWYPGTSTLVGSGSNTDGESGWFRPTVAITELRLSGTSITGFPRFQVWIAAAELETPTTTTNHHHANHHHDIHDHHHHDRANHDHHDHHAARRRHRGDHPRWWRVGDRRHPGRGHRPRLRTTRAGGIQVRRTTGRGHLHHLQRRARRHDRMLQCTDQSAGHTGPLYGRGALERLTTRHRAAQRSDRRHRTAGHAPQSR